MQAMVLNDDYDNGRKITVEIISSIWTVSSSSEPLEGSWMRLKLFR